MILCENTKHTVMIMRKRFARPSFVTSRLSSRRPKNRLGATLITVMILLPVLFTLAAMAINISYIQLIRTRAQITTDVAARAAGGVFAVTGDQAASLAEARSLATANPIESTVMSIQASDLTFGTSSRSSANSAYSFAAGSNGNSVRLTTNAFGAGAGAALRPIFPVFVSNGEIRPICTATHTHMTLDIALIVDRSGSMRFAADEPASALDPATAPGWQDGDPVPPNSRWLDLVAAVGGFCSELNQTQKIEKAALCSYANTSATHRFLTSQYSQIGNELNAISSSYHHGATNVGDGVLEGLAAVQDPSHGRSWASKALVLMSDGIHNTGTDPIVATQQAVTAGIPIYTVSFSGEADQVLMQTIADMTGGEHYHAVNASQLNAAFRDIARNLPSMLTQ